MLRPSAIGAIVVLGLVGCFGNPLDKQGGLFVNKPIETPEISDASKETAARVDRIGKQLLSQNIFLGVEPTFHTITRAEPEICHRDEFGVFVTEGLVNECRSDDEVAAVLATELGKMSSARRTAERMKLVQKNSTTGIKAIDPEVDALEVQAVFESKETVRDKKGDADAENPKAIASKILESAGFDPKSLDAVAPALRNASRNAAVAEQLGVRGNRPTWSR